jgi:hypothetical protein
MVGMSMRVAHTSQYRNLTTRPQYFLFRMVYRKKAALYRPSAPRIPNFKSVSINQWPILDSYQPHNVLARTVLHMQLRKTWWNLCSIAKLLFLFTGFLVQDTFATLGNASHSPQECISSHDRIVSQFSRLNELCIDDSRPPIRNCKDDTFL